MATLKEIEKMNAKEIFQFITKQNEKITKMRIKISELENELVPYTHVMTLRTTTRREREAWIEELNKEKE